jgi:hypothetical protein
MRFLVPAFGVLALALPNLASASESGDLLAQRLYDGTLLEARESMIAECESGANDACFAAGLLTLIETIETGSQAMYRHGSITPGMPAIAAVVGVGGQRSDGPLNPNPEPLSYEQLRSILADFVGGLDQARGYFEKAGEAGDYVLTVDLLRVRMDLNGDGTSAPEETLGALLAGFEEFAEEEVRTDQTGDTSVGFDRADALWFAGYTQIVATPLDLVLAHDFSDFFANVLHLVFPKSDLPMGPYALGGTLFIDAESDAQIADMIAGIHTMRFPVIDKPKLAGIADRVTAITDLSRRNWQAILAESDDNRELVPSPKQTSIFPDMDVTDATVSAWLAALDTIDEVVAGKLLVPHWRFAKGMDLSAYFKKAELTDVMLIFTGSGAIPYLKDGPIADAESFAQINEVLGDDWFNYAIWFN